MERRNFLNNTDSRIIVFLTKDHIVNRMPVFLTEIVSKGYLHQVYYKKEG